MSSISFKSVGDRATDSKFNREIDPLPIGFKTPLRLGTNRSGIFDMHFKIEDQIQDNLKNLLMTNHGERLGLFDFGANLRDLTAERTAKEDFDSEAMLRIKESVAKYMPFVELDSFESSFNKGMEVILHCIG